MENCNMMRQVCQLMLFRSQYRDRTRRESSPIILLSQSGEKSWFMHYPLFKESKDSLFERQLRIGCAHGLPAGCAKRMDAGVMVEL